MLWQPSGGIAAVQNNLPATPNLSFGITVTGSASANTKGSWAQLIASTTYDTYLIQLVVSETSASATQTDTLIDIGIGGAGSEQIILPNLLVGWKPDAGIGAMNLLFPMYIPKGIRIAARAQSVQTSKQVQVQIYCYGGKRFTDSPVYTRCDAYGITDSGASNGTSHTPGNSGAESTWASLGTTLSRNYRGFMFLAHGTLTVTAMTLIHYHWEIGYNSGAPVLGEFWYTGNTAERTIGPFPNFPIAASLASGTQMQVRGEASGTAQAYDVGLYCFY